jgi:hypothetical protein
MTPRESGVAEVESCEVLSEFLIVDQRWCARINWAMTTIKKWKEVTDSPCRIKMEEWISFFFFIRDSNKVRGHNWTSIPRTFWYTLNFPKPRLQVPKWDEWRTTTGGNGGGGPHIIYFIWKVNLSLLSRVCVCVCCFCSSYGFGSFMAKECLCTNAERESVLFAFPFLFFHHIRK